jgi:hypothetical protein
MIVVQEKCTRSLVVIVERRLKSPSSQTVNVRSIVRNAIKSIGHHADIRY